MVFIDTVNRENNLRDLEHIEAVNPCAEQPLPAYGCCCLGSIDLTKFARNPFTPEAAFDFDAFAALVPVAVRTLDDVLDAAVWPLEAQRLEAEEQPRVGLGFTGLSDCLILLAFADNVSNGIEPACAWEHERKSRLSGDAARAYAVQDQTYRLYRAQFGAKTLLREAFVSVLEIGVPEHISMVAAVAPYVDSSISKTVNVPADYPYSQFKNLYLDTWNLYLDTWRLGLKALSTFRESQERESVLSARTCSGAEAALEACPVRSAARPGCA
jgi:ribonucleotide reductase alpha subunit